MKKIVLGLGLTLTLAACASDPNLSQEEIIARNRAAYAEIMARGQQSRPTTTICTSVTYGTAMCTTH